MSGGIYSNDTNGINALKKDIIFGEKLSGKPGCKKINYTDAIIEIISPMLPSNNIDTIIVVKQKLLET